MTDVEKALDNLQLVDDQDVSINYNMHFCLFISVETKEQTLAVQI